jgi:streptogramin lyase
VKPGFTRAALCGLLLAFSSLAGAQGLGGRVTSAAEGPMEGVLVSARAAGSAVTLTVVSDRGGHFDFPRGTLAPGRYDLSIRAIGFDLQAPAAVDVDAKKNTAIEVKLRKTKDLAAQLTNTEWLMSMPGTNEQKRPLIECMSCHTYERIARSKYGADELLAALKRMATYANNSTTAKPQKRAVDRKFEEDALRRLADYLASVNLSKGEPWPYPLKTLARPSGRATRVLITEYDLPRRTIAPHDVRTDARGYVWYSNFVENTLGRLDPATGAHREFHYPEARKGFPTGALCLEADADGNLWLSGMFQTGVVKFDVAKETFRHFGLPKELNTEAAQQSMVMPRGSRVDGKVWSNEVSRQSILRLDTATGKYEQFDVFKSIPGSHAPYGLVADAANNLFFMDFGGEAIGRIDAKTGQASLYPTPTKRSRPRRTMMDAEGRVWFAEFAANKVAMFDPKEEAFREWDAPTPHTYPYDVFVDRNGELWSGSMSGDRVLRMDTKSGASVEYLLPRPTNVRRVFVDNSTTPVTFWVGSNHGASIVKLQALD